MFSQSTRLQIRESILISLIKNSIGSLNSDGCLLQRLPKDILWIICQFIPSHERQKHEKVLVNTIYSFVVMCYRERNVPNIASLQQNGHSSLLIHLEYIFILCHAKIVSTIFCNKCTLIT